MSTDFFNKRNLFLTFIGFFLITYLINNCTDLVFFEYLKIKFTTIENFRNLYINTQFINESTQSRFCLLTTSEVIYNQFGVPELLKIYLPRQARVLLQQFLIVIIVFTILLKDSDYKKNIFLIDSKFLMITTLGLFINYLIISIYVDFETFFYSAVFLVFSIFKSLIAYIYINQNKSYLKLFILCIFPFFSSGFGISWMFDFLIYFFLFNFFLEKETFLKNKNLIILIFVLTCSLLAPFLNTPSLETQIIDNPNEYKNIIDNINFQNSKNTFLEKKDIAYLNENIIQLEELNIKKEVVNLSRNLKDTNYPNRWGIMVSFLPDIKYHLPSFLWYLSLSYLFLLLINQINLIKYIDLKDEMKSSSNILIFYPILSIFLGINYFFHSISDFLFFLTRKSEMIDFGEIQTWRGINTHYEIFSNLQLFCFCFFVMNFYVNKSFKSFFFIMISTSTALLSQSRFTALILFIFLFILFFTSIKQFKVEIISLILFVVLIFQFIPIFDRQEPFFIDESDLTSIEIIDNDIYGFEFISDRLNRTLPWTMFASGYNPNSIELIFGHGTGSYLNIIKFTERDLASGPHSMLLQILNRFGLLGLVIFIIYILKYFIHITSNTNIKHTFLVFFVFSLLFSLELKTDSIMLADGVAIFLFNILLGIIYSKLYSENIN
ncbi:MAG: hypothetical protein CMC31_05880 [Flavobacteriaceae bacterium]|nr:hypothetical protein [Flavobacteriaceae bacterium]